MPPADRDLLTEVLRACYDAAPEPLYPARFASAAGLYRTTLDRALDELRLSGLVRLTEWVQGLGQGYTLTHAGLAALEDLHQLRRGGPLPVTRPPLEELEPEHDLRPRRPLITPGRPVMCWTLIGANVFVFLVGLYLATRNGATVNDYLSGTQVPGVSIALHDLGSLS